MLTLVPYVLASQGTMLAGRASVFNVSQEGITLAGASVGFLGAYLSGGNLLQGTTLREIAVPGLSRIPLRDTRTFPLTSRRASAILWRHLAHLEEAITDRDLAALDDVGSQPGAVHEGPEHARLRLLLEIGTRLAQADAQTQCFTDSEPLADQDAQVDPGRQHVSPGGPLWATASGAVPRRPCSGLGWSLKVQTPSPYWTA